jgi:hypothetical protein
MSVLVWPGSRCQAAQTAYDGSSVIGYGDPEYSEGGAWQQAGDDWQERGQSYSLARKTTADGAWAMWKPDLPRAGKYRVWIWNIPYYTQDSQAKIEISHAGGVTAFVHNLDSGYYGWLPLGDFEFDAGSSGSVKITRGGGTLLVNAVRLLPVGRVRKPRLLEPYPKPDGRVPHLDGAGPTAHLILGGKPYLMLGAELENGSALDPEDIPAMDPLFDILLSQRINTVEAPISWKQLEPSEGHFDFRVIDALIQHARARNMHLSILWFGAYKNLQSYYTPLWVIHNTTRFFRAKDENGKEMGAISPFCTAALDADTTAFGKLLRRIVEKDPDHQVVLMAQVENEMPSWRDYSAPGMDAWLKSVPAALLDAIKGHTDTISPWLRSVWERNGRRTAGAWVQVFGDNNDGARVFGSWYYGRYADAVAAAGKAVLPVPMYANSWQGESPCWPHYMDIFHAAAPHIDMMGPDLYLDRGYEQALQEAQRPWNTLVSPENNGTTAAGSRAWVAYGSCGCLYFGSYQGPETEWTRCGDTYPLLEQMAPLILNYKGTAGMMGFCQEVSHAGDTWDASFQGCQLHFTATAAVDPGGEKNNITGGECPGAGLIIQTGPRVYVVTASRVSIDWTGSAGRPISVDRAEEGHFQAGRWIRDRAVTIQKSEAGFRLEFPHTSGVYRQVKIWLSE